ncbi:hypothetical protein J4443_04095 [Candidatus Woesearchaeota archaeon]|nr:hypothetical protein [Candidatus Woesearchaeota archaeon]
MVKLGAEDIVFFVSIGLIIFILLWLLSGSPALNAALVSIGVLFINSEFSLWKKFFQLENKINIGFERVKNDIEKLNMRLDTELKYIKENLVEIRENIKNKK